MDRRAFAARAGALATAALAGCLSDPRNVPGGAGGSDDGSTDTPMGSPTPTESPEGTDGPDDEPTESNGDATETGTPATGDPAVDAAFEVRGVSSGNGENSATVEFGDGEVTVDGTIGGNNGCYTARLAAAEYTGDALRVLVEAYEDRDDDEMCTQSLVDVDYVATFAVDGAAPERVVVEHDSRGEVRTVADESR